MQRHGLNRNSFAQGTIEYLVVVAVIVVISLVVVALVSNNMDSFLGISSVSSKISSSSGIISISEAVLDVDGDGLVTLANNSGGSLTITGISVGGTVLDYSDVSLFQGDKKVFSLSDINSGCSCVGFVGQKKTCSGVITVISEYGLESEYPFTLNIDCVQDAVPVNLSLVVEPIVPVVGHFCGEFSGLPGYTVISDCSEIISSGNYILDGNLSCPSSLTIGADDVNIFGNYCMVTGNIEGASVGAGENGYDFNLNNIFVDGNVSSVGGTGASYESDAGNGGASGAIGLFGVTVSSVVSTGGAGGISNDNYIGRVGGSSGLVMLVDSVVSGIVSSVGGAGGSGWVEAGAGGAGGLVSIINSSVSSISSVGGVGMAGDTSSGAGGAGSSVTVSDSVVSVISSIGGAGSSGSWSSSAGGSAGSITLEGVTGLTEVNAIGGSSPTTPGNGGNVTFVIPCPDVMPTINVSGGAVPAHCSYNDPWCNESEDTCVNMCGGSWLPASTGTSGTITPPEGMCNAKIINSFDFSGFYLNGRDASIGSVDEINHTISVNVPSIANIASLTPTIDYIGLSVSPSGAQDFSSPVTYTITSADSSTQDYVITVTPLDVYNLDFNIKEYFSEEQLTTGNIDCNVNDYDFNNNLTSLISVDFYSGSYSCTFSKTSYDSNTLTIIADSNKASITYLNFTPTSYIHLSDCNTLSIEGGYYILDNNFGSGGDCLTVTANNVRIDGDNHSINGRVNANGYSPLAVRDFVSTDINAHGSTGSGGNGWFGGYGSTVYLVNSTTGVISAFGGNNVNGYRGTGGNVFLTNSVANTINVNGGYGWDYVGNGPGGGHGGQVTVKDSIVQSVLAKGGDATDGTQGGASHGGTVIFDPCPTPTPDVNVIGGIWRGTVGVSGTITPVDCHN